MSPSRTSDLKNIPDQKPRPPIRSVVVTLEQLKEWVKKGAIVTRFCRYQKAELLAKRVEFIPKPFLCAFLLLFLSPRNCYFKDERGHREKITFHVLTNLIGQLRKDFGRKNAFLRRKGVEVEKAFDGYLPRRDRKPVLGLSGFSVYLRTDLVFGLQSGGSIAHTAGVLNHLDEFSGKPLFFTTDVIPTVRNDFETHLICPSREFWDFREIPSIYFNETFERSAREYIGDRKVSFIYQRYSVNNYCGLKLAKYYDVPFVLEYNGSEIWISRHWGNPLKYEKLSQRIERLNLEAAEVVVVVSRPMKEELIARGIHPEKILVNPNGVDPERYFTNIDGSRIRNQYQLVGKTVLGFMGTFGKWHGAELLAEAFGLLVSETPGYRDRIGLLMIGDGVTLPLVKQNLEKYGASESCVLTGLIPQEQGPEYLAACDILVASHRPNPDGTPFFGSPTKLFEYMAMGRGIVASDLDQIGEVLTHDRTAWMVRPGDTRALKEGLKMLVEDKQRRERLGRAAREEAVAKHTWREHTRKIIEKLKERCG